MKTIKSEKKILNLIAENKEVIISLRKFLKSKGMIITDFGEGITIGKIEILKKQNQQLLKIISNGKSRL